MTARASFSVEVSDSGSTWFDAKSLVIRSGRDPAPAAARLGRQFIEINKAPLSAVGVSARTDFDGDAVRVHLTSGTTIGSVPLRSPSSGDVEYGLVVRPRYGWAGLGPMMATMGWRITPNVARLPNLPRSDRRIPAWVLSSIVLARMEAMLRATHRRFAMAEETVSAPRGQINWTRYASESLVRGRPDAVPCRFPELGRDRSLLAAIHYVLRIHAGSLGSQRGTGGAAVLSLLTLTEGLLQQVRDIPPERPVAGTLRRWLRTGLASESFHDGIEAIGWTAEERGLGGLADLRGLPWTMSMETLFEAWVETLASRISARIGGTVRAGRQLQTLAPLRWDPPFLGSQRYLLPDVVLERADTTFVFDAKYKTHFEELNASSWFEVEDVIRERHHDDLLQILAYSTLFQSPKVVCCLIYPCTWNTWESLRDRGRTSHRAGVAAGNRQVDLMLTAVPMATSPEPLELLAAELQRGV